jgi:acetoin utilization deacetylase AcuC-like enzyme
LRVHPEWYLDRIEAICDGGGGRLDPDTYASPAASTPPVSPPARASPLSTSCAPATATRPFCAVRPPGHHATAIESMGFCMISNVAVVAAALAAEGERVLIFDYDAHHGNGTQAVFYEDPRVLFVSLHQWPLYPGSGRIDETGSGAGEGTTVNIPLPAHTTGDVYLRAFDEIIAPIATTSRRRGSSSPPASTRIATTRSPRWAWPPATTGRSPRESCRSSPPVGAW